MKRLREKAQAAKQKYGFKAREVFEFFDADLSGEIDAREFADGLMRLQLDCDRDEVAALMAAFGGSGGDGKKVSYRNFLKTLELGGDGELLSESVAAKKDVADLISREAPTRALGAPRPPALREEVRGTGPRRPASKARRRLRVLGYEMTGPEMRRSWSSSTASAATGAGRLPRVVAFAETSIGFQGQRPVSAPSSAS